MNNKTKRDLNISGKLLPRVTLLITITFHLAVGVLNTLPILGAQVLTSNRFDVASIKPADPKARGISIRPIAGGITITNMQVKELIVLAYRIQLFQISGGPPWMNSDHYDISAKSENPAKREEILVMLQALLADRFKLSVHRENKELPIYALVLARKDGKLGPRLVEAKTDNCITVDPNKAPPPPEPGTPPPLSCGGMRMRPNALTAASIQVSELTQNFSRLLGRTVIDKTGLAGKYDISMEWAPDEPQSPQAPGAPLSPASEPSGPSIFTAIQEQLGLKFEAQKGQSR
jgi:bla regulator protein blaR1